LELARLLAATTGGVVAAYATVDADDITLVCRLIDGRTGEMWDAVAVGRTPSAVAADAARRLIALGVSAEELAS
jgi:hypothetical protein